MIFILGYQVHRQKPNGKKGACYSVSMCLHARNTAYCTIRTVRVCRALVCGSDCLDIMHIATGMDIRAETSCANTDVISHIDGEKQVMIDLFDIG